MTGLRAQVETEKALRPAANPLQKFDCQASFRNVQTKTQAQL
jgi:hypothetical protein